MSDTCAKCEGPVKSIARVEDPAVTWQKPEHAIKKTSEDSRQQHPSWHAAPQGKLFEQV